MKLSVTLAVSIAALFTTVPAAAVEDNKDPANILVNGVNGDIEHYDPQQTGLNEHHNLTKRGWSPDWYQSREIFIGVGNVPMGVGSHSDDRGFIKAITRAGEKLCDRAGGSHFDDCHLKISDESNVWRVKTEPEFIVHMGGHYFPYNKHGLREALFKIAAQVFQNITDYSCRKDERGHDFCWVPDKIFVRIGFIGWVMVYLEAKKVEDEAIRVCAKKGWSDGKKSERIVDWIMEHNRKEVAEILGIKSENIKVRVDCFIGTQPATEGNGWCRDRKGWKENCD